MSENSREKAEMFTLNKIIVTIFCVSIINKYYSIKVPTIVRVAHPNFSVIDPYNTTRIITEDKYKQLVDLNNFSFKINPQPCKDYPEGLLLMIIVSSNPNNYEKRSAIRSTWGRNLEATKVVFLVGEPANVTVFNQILNESAKYGDVVQGNFVDAYRNMTYKHVMGLKWIAHHCPTAKYILKTDDDVLVNTFELRHFLAREMSPWGARDLITCQVLENALAQRSSSSKWKVSTEEYPLKYYPTYCAGWAVLYSQDVIPRLLKAAQSVPYFWIDDVHITGICAELIGVKHTSFSSLILSSTRMNILTMLGPKYVGSFLFGPPDLTSEKIKLIWQAIPK